MKYSLLIFFLVFIIFAKDFNVVASDSQKATNNVTIDYLYAKDTKLANLLNILSIMTSVNINGTANLVGRKLSLTTQGLTLKQLIKEISNSLSNAVPYYDLEIKTYRIVELSEYDKFASLTKNDYKIEVFSVRPVNLTNIAVGIEEIYGDRVQLSLGGEILDFASSGGGGSSGGGSGSGGSGSGGSSDGTDSGEEKTLTREEVLKVFEGREVQQEEGLPIFMSINNEHSAIIIRTKDLRVLEEIRTYISTLNLPVKQVLLEMQILDISLTNNDALGVSFNADQSVRGNPQNQLSIANGFASNFSTGVDGTTSSLLFDYFGDKFNVRVLAALQDNRLETISNPVIVAMNNRTSTISIGESRRIVTGFSEQTTTVTNGVTTVTGGIPQLSETTIGTQLSVIPRIFNKEYLNLYVDLSVDTLGDPLTINGESIDTINAASFNSSILARNKEIVAIGGIIRKEKRKVERKVPFLSRLPIIGELFKSEENSYLRSELLLLVRPHIVSPENPEKSTEYLEGIGAQHPVILEYNEEKRNELTNIKERETQQYEKYLIEEKERLNKKLIEKNEELERKEAFIKKIQKEEKSEKENIIENRLDENIQDILKSIDSI